VYMYAKPGCLYVYRFLKLNTSRCEDQSRGFSGVLLGSQALRWRVPGSVLSAAETDDALLGC
jgi:hypothetical protein